MAAQPASAQTIPDFPLAHVPAYLAEGCGEATAIAIQVGIMRSEGVPEDAAVAIVAVTEKDGHFRDLRVELARLIYRSNQNPGEIAYNFAQTCMGLK